jgi:hypothetical protein
MKAIFSLKDLETLLAPEAAKRVGTNTKDPSQRVMLYQVSVDTLAGDSEACVVVDVEFTPEAEKALTVPAKKTKKRR